MLSIIVLSVVSVLMLMLSAFNQRKLVLPLAALGMIATIALSIGDIDNGDAYFNNMLFIDNLSAILSICIGLVMIGVFAVATKYYHDNVPHLSDLFALLVFSTIGGLLLMNYSNLTMLFVALEILSIPLYVLAGSHRDDLRGNESALKYFIMGAFASAIMLFGIALVYGATASFDLISIHSWLVTDNSTMFQLGAVLIVFGFLFKIAVAPFHFWAPDVYQGAPSIITMYMSTVVKIAAVAGLWRFMSLAGYGDINSNVPLLPYLICTVIVLTLVFATISALKQTNFKRLMAYSSISNGGLLLLPFLVLNNPAALCIYLLAYAIANVLLFTIYIAIKQATNDAEIEAFKGMMKCQPVLGMGLFIGMLSLSGVPPLAGFFGKLYLLLGVANAAWWGMAIVAIVASLIGLYYYVRVALAALQPATTQLHCPAVYKWVVVVCSFLLIVLGFFSGLIADCF